MPVKHHPFFQAPAGSVFAILIAPGKWGFVRFFDGLAMGVLSVVGNAPVLPKIDWAKPPIGWTFFSFAPDKDTTEAVPLGLVPFDHAEAAWAPPCFYPPDLIQNCYRIHYRGMIQKPATARDVEGMTQCRRVTPTELAEFLRERLAAGGLKEI